MTAPGALRRSLSTTEMLICFVAALGFAFDTYELLMLPLIVRPALMELLHVPAGHPSINEWVGILFYVPAVAGGIFGLIGGYLTDLFGRRRVLVWSILIYAVSAMAAGFATSVPMLLFWRCTTFIGVCVEFVAAVAWLAELFPDSERREKIVGYTQAFGSLGGLMVTGAYYLAVTYGPSLPVVAGGHEAWRYTLMSGLIPAIPLMIVRPFLPESPIWFEKKRAGTLGRPSFAALFTPEFRRTTIVTTLMMACGYAAAFGAIQQVPRIVPGMDGVRTLARPAIETAVSSVQSYQEFGGLAGRVLLAFLAVRIVSRRGLLRVFQVPGLILMPTVLLIATTHDLQMLKWGIFALGLTTIGQFSFWGNYLPRMYPTHLRGTGESFAANVGGRMIGTCAALVTTQLVPSMPGGSPAMQLAYAAAIVGTTVYVAAFALSAFLPEPREETLRQ